MARRRGGMMTALQAALAGVSGGIEGRMQQRVMEEEQSRAAAALERQGRMDARQTMVDQAKLMADGFEPVADVRRKQQDAFGAAGSLIGSALNAASGNFGGPMPSAAAQESLASGYAEARPSRTISFEGQELALRETQNERQERLGRVSSAMSRAEKEQEKRDKVTDTQRLTDAKKNERENQIKTYMDVGYSRRDATMLADNASAFTAMRGQDISATTARQAQALAKSRFDMDKEKFAFDQTKESQPKADKAAKLAAAKKAANDVLPTVIDASNAVSKWGEDQVKSLSPFRIAAQNAAVLEGGLWGAVKSKALSKTGISDLDKQYLQYASAVADAVARASEVGVLTNQDINRFRSQVSFDGGENEAQIRFKLGNLKKWASWLANSKKNIDEADGDTETSSSNYGKSGRIPGESMAEYKIRIGAE